MERKGSPPGLSFPRTRESTFPRIPKIILILVGLVVVFAITYTILVRRAGSDKPDETKAAPAIVEIAQAQVQPVDTVVTAQGTLTASQGGSAKIAPVVAGRLVSVSVREGDTVRAGQVIAVLDSRLSQAQAASALSALRVSEIQAQQSATAAKAAATDNANAVQTARLELQIAQTDLKKLQNGARPQEIAQAEQSVKQAQATRDRAASELERVQFLVDKGIKSKRELDDAKTALSVADSTLESAHQQASLVKAGSRPEDIQSAQLKVKSAEAALRQAEQGSLQVAAKRQEAQAALESIRQKRADLAAAQVAASYSELRAPISGKVIHRSLNPGDMADITTPVVEIADTHSLNLVAGIPAEDGSAIRVGMPAHVRVTNAPGKVFSGAVTNVGEVDPQTGMLSVRLAVPASSNELKVGVFATADIVIHNDPGAVVVPKSAVLSRNGHDAVFVVDKGNIAHQINVTTGPEQGDVVEIRSGLRPGDRVITLGQYELSDGVEVKPAQKNAQP